MNQENLLRAITEILTDKCETENRYPADVAEEYMETHPDTPFTYQEVLDAVVAQRTENDLED